MQQRLSLLTLGVRDLAAARAFYRRWGWVEAHEGGNIAFFQLNGFGLALYPQDALAEDACVPVEGRGATLAICCRSPAEVDAAMREAEKAGAEVVKPAAKAFWGGYSGYVRDPEGWLWELAHNPFSTLTEDGDFIIGGGEA